VLNLTRKLKRLCGQGNTLHLIHKRSRIKSNFLDHNLQFVKRKFYIMQRCKSCGQYGTKVKFATSYKHRISRKKRTIYTLCGILFLCSSSGHINWLTECSFNFRTAPTCTGPGHTQTAQLGNYITL
jgi:hypothetical protein